MTVYGMIFVWALYEPCMNFGMIFVWALYVLCMKYEIWNLYEFCIPIHEAQASGCLYEVNMKFVLLFRNQSSLYGFCISSGIQTLSKPHTNIERYMHVTVMKRNTKFIQTWYNQTLDYVCMIFKFNLNEDCIYFVCNLSYVWLLYMAWYLYGPCMNVVWGLYALCMKYELCMNYAFFDGSHIL